MRDHTVCLLKECDSGCKMALDSMAQIKGYVSDQKLKNTIDGYEKKHQAMEEEAYKQLKSLGEGARDDGGGVFPYVHRDENAHEGR